MSREDLQKIIGNALVDRTFCDELLRSPELVMQEFDLSDVELQAVMSIQAQSLEEFAVKLDRWIAKSAARGCEPEMIAEPYPKAYQLAG